jgi:putative component of toxin-antitoxin plasmid stabilization module
MNKMTNWFPSHIKPVHKGVYEVRTPNHRGNKYCYYDQHGWRLCSDRIDYAEQEKHYTSEFIHSSMLLVGSKWRGFTKEQT